MGVTSYLYSTCSSSPNKQGSYTVKYKRCTIGCCGDQLHKH